MAIMGRYHPHTGASSAPGRRSIAAWLVDQEKRLDEFGCNNDRGEPPLDKISHAKQGRCARKNMFRMRNSAM